MVFARCQQIISKIIFPYKYIQRALQFAENCTKPKLFNIKDDYPQNNESRPVGIVCVPKSKSLLDGKIISNSLKPYSTDINVDEDEDEDFGDGIIIDVGFGNTIDVNASKIQRTGIYKSSGIKVYLPECSMIPGTRRYRIENLPGDIPDDSRIIFYKN